MLGLSDEMRSNFQVMKELAVHTRMAPEPRACQLQAFIKEVEEYVLSYCFTIQIFL